MFGGMEMEEQEPEAKIERDIENMFRTLEALDSQMKRYTDDPKGNPRPNYERYNNWVLDYDKVHQEGWTKELRWKYERVLEKRACYEDLWVRWCEEAGVYYHKAGRKI